MKVEAINPYECKPRIKPKKLKSVSLKEADDKVNKVKQFYRNTNRRDFDLPTPNFIHLRRYDSGGNILNSGGITIAYHHNKNNNFMRVSYARCRADENYSKKLGRIKAAGRFVSKTKSFTVEWMPDGGDEKNPLEFILEEVRMEISDLQLATQPALPTSRMLHGL